MVLFHVCLPILPVEGTFLYGFIPRLSAHPSCRRDFSLWFYYSTSVCAHPSCRRDFSLWFYSTSVCPSVLSKGLSCVALFHVCVPIRPVEGTFLYGFIPRLSVHPSCRRDFLSMVLFHVCVPIRPVEGTFLYGFILRLSAHPSPFLSLTSVCLSASVSMTARRYFCF